MYENGRRLTRYAEKRKHIDKQKQKFLRNPFMNPGGTYAQYLATADDFDRRVWGCRDIPYCEQYWRFAYATGPRKYAKEMTNSVIRSHNRSKIAEFFSLDEEEWDDFDYAVEQHNGYQKHYDYLWTVW